MIEITSWQEENRAIRERDKLQSWIDKAYKIIHPRQDRVNELNSAIEDYQAEQRALDE